LQVTHGELQQRHVPAELGYGAGAARLEREGQGRLQVLLRTVDVAALEKDATPTAT
jgi:hypothetical protein